ncbi:MAG: prepilin-type N-terminal cleavage/methylation domain-containing protein [Candidatus Saccharimonadales bacterium]
MLQNIKQKRQEGFTIIEVLIVLAIAGLIMVVVFLAVPALQRNSRNNALKTDANNVLSGVGEYLANNAGTLPSAVALAGTTVTVGATGTNQSTVNVGGGTTGAQLNGATPTGIGVVQVVTGVKCTGSSGATTATGASGRSYVVVYRVETGSGTALICTGS